MDYIAAFTLIIIAINIAFSFIEENTPALLGWMAAFFSLS